MPEGSSTSSGSIAEIAHVHCRAPSTIWALRAPRTATRMLLPNFPIHSKFKTTDVRPAAHSTLWPKPTGHRTRSGFGGLVNGAVQAVGEEQPWPLTAPAVTMEITCAGVRPQAMELESTGTCVQTNCTLSQSFAACTAAGTSFHSSVMAAEVIRCLRLQCS